MARLTLCLWLVSLSLAPAQTPLLKAPPGFKVEMVLQAPDIEAPTALAVAPNGDVYYAEDPMDMRGPTTKNIDKIWLLKGGDPKKKILVADELWAVMGMELVRDKLFVVHPPYVTVFTLDAEGKVNTREDLFTDLGPKVAGLPSFNDHVCSGIRMGVDGWLYVSIGDKGIPAMTRKEKDKGSVHVAEGRWRHSKEGNVISLEGGGVIRFRPDGSGLEVFASGTRNHLDVPLDEHDRIFVRDNTNDGGGWNTRLMYLPPGGFMGYPWDFSRPLNHAAPPVHDFGGGSPCGGWVYLDDALPGAYKGRIFHCEWGKGKVYAVKVAPLGANFKFVDEVAFLDPEGTGVKDFRPFTLRPTADGRGFYVTDWAYNGWTNKAVAGRLWKVTYTGDDVQPVPRLDLDRATLTEVCAALSHSAHTQRVAAQRELIARAAKQPKEVRAALTAALKENTVTAYRHAVWVDAALPDGGDLALRLLGHPDNGLRIEALRVAAGRDKLAGQDTTPLIVGRVFNETFVQVRLHVLAALRGRKVSPQDGANLYFALSGEMDATVRHVLGRALTDPVGRQAVYEGVKLSGGAQGQAEQGAKSLCWLFAEAFDLEAVDLLIALLKNVEPTVREYAVDSLATNYKDRKPYAGTWWGTRPEQQPPPGRVVEWEGTAKVRDAIVGALADKDADVRKAAVRALVAMRDPATFEPLKTRYAEERDAATKVDLVRALAGLRTPEGTALLREVAGADDAPVAVRVAALEGLTGANVAPGPALVERGLQAKDAALRKATLAALRATGKAADGKAVRPLVTDADLTVKLAAIQTLGVLGDRESIPALLDAVAVEATQFDAVTALTKMPDKRAVAAYLLGLASKNQPLRQASATALAAIRDEAAPVLKQLVERKEVPEAVLPELRAVYARFEPVAAWAVVGPFPEGKAPVAPGNVNLTAKYLVEGKEVAWRKDVKGDAKNHGKVNLGNGSDVVSYAFAEIESADDRPATLRLGSDDTLRVWLNGDKVFEFTGSRGWGPDQNKADVKLKKGKNALLVECGNKSGPWEFSVAVSADVSKYAFLQGGGGGKLDLEAYRAHARKTAGDPERGRKLYLDAKGLACAKCHALGSDGGKVGPALDDVGLKYKREEIMTAILEPSRTIANGYDSVVVETKAGKLIAGVSKGERDGAVLVMDDEAKLHTIRKEDVEELTRSPVSRMPNGLNEGMTAQDFADLVAFLERCRQEKPK